MRKKYAQRIVHWIARALDEGYLCWATRDREGHAPRDGRGGNTICLRGLEDFWAQTFRRREQRWMRVALRLDREAAIDQMAMEGWWG